MQPNVLEVGDLGEFFLRKTLHDDWGPGAIFEMPKLRNEELRIVNAKSDAR